MYLMHHMCVCVCKMMNEPRLITRFLPWFSMRLVEIECYALKNNNLPSISIRRFLTISSLFVFLDVPSFTTTYSSNYKEIADGISFQLNDGLLLHFSKMQSIHIIGFWHWQNAARKSSQQMVRWIEFVPKNAHNQMCYYVYQSWSLAKWYVNCILKEAFGIASELANSVYVQHIVLDADEMAEILNNWVVSRWNSKLITALAFEYEYVAKLSTNGCFQVAQPAYRRRGDRKWEGWCRWCDNVKWKNVANAMDKIDTWTEA